MLKVIQKVISHITITALVLILINNKVYAKEVIVNIYKKKFIPAEITIEQGDIVIWKNIEKRQYHNVWFKQFDKEDPDYLFPDDTYQLTFDEKGTFSYECGPHPKMIGKVTVMSRNRE
ncbi:MAG: plastocyanin [Gammaproteobacteria bacterium]|nr:MAG: plastocyanin [Gammaproteobacteria bacterium]